MESNEEYLLRALRRTSNGLTDSLIPAHGAKLTKLLNRFETADALTGEVQTLMHVQGFGKCALAMEWLLERTKRTTDYFSPEQFESDVLLLNEKLFEAFLNQPFDMPDFSRSFEAPARPVQNIHVSDEEFMGTSFPSTSPNTSFEALQDQEPGQDLPHTFSEPTWDTSSITRGTYETFPVTPAEETPAALGDSSGIEPSWPPRQASSDPFEAALMASVSGQTGSTDDLSGSADTSPSLRESMSPDLFDATERVAQTAVEFIEKSSSDRPVAMAVFRVTVRAASESAKSSSNLVAQDLFDAMLKLIAYADEQGKIKSEAFGGLIRDLGDRLTHAITLPIGGMSQLKHLTNHLKDPKELFSKG
jgi:hypothetical protein